MIVLTAIYCFAMLADYSAIYFDFKAASKTKTESHFSEASNQTLYNHNAPIEIAFNVLKHFPLKNRTKEFGTIIQITFQLTESK